MTTWSAPVKSVGLAGDTFALPLMQSAHTDIVTAATPLGAFKFEHAGTAVGPLMPGTTVDPLGNLAGAMPVVCLAWKRFSTGERRSAFSAPSPCSRSWRTVLTRPRSPVHAVFRRPDARHRVHGYRHGDVADDKHRTLDLRSGNRCARRDHSHPGLPEGVMYSILLMNAIVPFINRSTQPRVFGTLRQARDAA